MNKPINIKIRFRTRLLVKLLILPLLFAFIIACEDDDEHSDYNPPADHTISQEGIMHKSGLNQPFSNCVNCHGADLQGGTTGVSCYECHGEKW